jgi:hypothetical protein
MKRNEATSYQTFRLKLPDEFFVACTVYEQDPSKLLQEFLNQMSFPKNDDSRGDLNVCATFFFIEHTYQKWTERNVSQYSKQQLNFLAAMEQQRKSMLEKIKDCTPKQKQQALEKFFSRFRRQWNELDNGR